MDAELKRMLVEQRGRPNFLLCRHREKDWNGSDPVCAFDEDGKFREDNWRCWLMSQVRCLMGHSWFGPNEGMPGHYWWDDDQNYGVLYIRSWMHQKETDSYLSGAFVLLDWYKSRGATDSFRILQGDTIRQGTEKDAEEIVRLYAEEIAKLFEDDEEEEEEMPGDDVGLFMPMLMDLSLEEKKRLVERLNEVIETGGD